MTGLASTGEAATVAETGLALVEQIFSIFHTKAVLREIAKRNEV